ncbi:MAG: adenosylcobinamide-GDP ribazoletransferase, partial [Pseudomonadota bacterium]
PVALVFMTRLPLPALPASAFERGSIATWAYPLAGLVLGLLAALLWAVTGWLGLSAPLQAGVSLAALALMTGALHEDGLADMADGFWGGHDATRRLEIMKDSRIGSYGVLALIFVVGLRWSGLTEAGIAALIAAACLSRAILPLMMYFGPFARPDGLAKSVGQPPKISVAVSIALGLVVAWACVGFGAMLIAALVVFLVGECLHKLAKYKIGGVTGDVLGATQQLSELAVLLALAAVI